MTVDQSWSDDPDVIWYDSFDGAGSLLDRYLECSSSFVNVDDVALGGPGKSMRAHWEPGQVGAGGLKKCFGRCPADYRGTGVRRTEDFRDIYWRHYIRHQPEWVGNPAKVSRAIAFAGSNWSQAMIAHVWGGHNNSLCTDPARGVNAQSQVVTTCYNDFPNLNWLGYRHSEYQVFDTDESGRWLCVEAHVRLNTPGQSDGVFTLTLDGQVACHRDDLNWVYSWDDYGINAVFLENYWNSGSPVAQERWFDDFVISTSPIGLAKSPTTPTVWKTGFRDDDTGDAQTAWRLQVATDLAGSDVVWDSGILWDAGDSVVIDAVGGAFAGSLTGYAELLSDTLYALRARQRDGAGDWSTWGPWMTVLQVEELLAGDANRDKLVDGADLAAWQTGYDPLATTPGLFADGDFNQDARIDGADLALWQQNYDPLGAGGLDGATSIPEPNTLVLLGTGLLAAVGLKRRFTPFSSRERQ